VRLRQATDRELETLEAIAAAESQPWNRLVALIDRNLNTPVNIHVLLIEFWRCGIRDSELRDYGRAVWTRYSEPFRRAVIEGRDAGVFTTPNRPEDIVDLLLRSLAGAMFPRVLEIPARSAKRFRNVLLDQVAAALGVGDDARE
jgi:hypothetical protein